MALTKISTAMISQSAAAVDLNVDAGTFYVDTTNNRVGVGGKTDPDTPLHVVGTATATLFAGSGASLTSIPNAALVNSSITINSTAVSLGGSLTLTTANIAENTNLYYTDARADARIAAADTDDLSEGSSNLYYTDARVDARVSGGSLGNITTTGYIRGPSSFTIDPAAHGDDTGTVVIAGNLQVDGTTTTINSTTLTVDDKNITLASGSANAAAASGAGFTVDIGTGTLPSITYDGTNDEWDFNKPLNVTGTISSGAITARADTDALFVKSVTNQNAAEIAFSSQGPSTYAQIGRISYQHGDTLAYGGTDVFTISTTESAPRILADGLLMFKSGLALKPASGTGAGTTLITSGGALQNITTISSGAITSTGKVTAQATDSEFYNRLIIKNGTNGLYMGQWDGSTHRIEADANRPLTIQAYNSGGITLGISGNSKLVVTNAGVSTPTKLAVMSSGTHGTYDFYNNGTSYFNGSVIVDDHLSITGTNAQLTLSRTSTDQTAGFNLTNNQNGGYGSGIIWNSKRSDAGLLTAAEITVSGENSWNSDATSSSMMQFATRKDNTLTTHMTIRKTGNVGIGTDNPPNLLSVRKTTTAYEDVISIIGQNSPTDIMGALAYDQSTDLMIIRNDQTYATGGIAFRAGGTSNHLFIKTGGNVGIGTTSPYSKLWVSGPGINAGSELTTDDANSNALLTLAGNNALVRLQMGTMDVSPYGAWIQGSYDNSGGADGVEPLILNPIGGNVGIGVINPGQTLEIHNSDASDYTYEVLAINMLLELETIL